MPSRTPLWTTLGAALLWTCTQEALANTTEPTEPTQPTDTVAHPPSQSKPNDPNVSNNDQNNSDEANDNTANPTANGSVEPSEPAGTVDPSAPAAPADSTEPTVPDAGPDAAPDVVDVPSQDTSPGGLDAATERRGGFVVGVIAGPTLGWATGNPSAKSERDNPSFERSTGLGVGYRVTPFLGGALTDWFTFGLGMSFGSLSASDLSSPLTTFVFHLEVYPLYGRGDVFRDIGVTIDVGAGASSIVDKNTDSKVAASGAMSSVGLGVLWEPWRWNHFAAGPFLGFQHNWSRWFARSDVTLGLRGMFYGVQP